MKNKLNKQILSALLAVLILVSAFPNTAYSVENETEPTVSMEATEIPTIVTEATEEPAAVTETSEISTTSTEAAMSETVDGEETETTAATEEVETPSEGEEEADVSCPYCELTVAEDGTVVHADDCNTRFAVDASGRVGKTAAFNMDYDSVHYSNSKPAEGFDYNSEDDGKSDYLTAWYDSFDPPLVEITNWFWEVSGCALWYQVRPLSGETLPEGMTTESWLYQTSTNISGDINALVMVSADVLGKNVVFAQATAQLYNDYFAPMGVDGTQMPAMTVVDLCANNAETWYYVDAAEGETWPEAYADYHYVLSTDVVLQTPVDPEDPTEPENPCDCGCENCTGEEGCACKCGQCDFCQREFEDGPITGSAGGKIVTVSGDKIPAGATVSVSDLSSAAGGDTGIYNIKVMDGDKVWQPAPGETVRVSIPAPAGASTVHVAHFLEDVETIKWSVENSLARIVECGDMPDEYMYIFAAAIAAYQAAFDTSQRAVVLEGFEYVSVDNGIISIDSHGFSVFVNTGTADNPVYIESPTNNIVSIDKDNTQLYVRPGDWIRLTAGGGLATDMFFTEGKIHWLTQLYTEVDAPSYATVLDQTGGFFSDATSFYVKISENAPLGSTFKIGFNSVVGSDGFWNKYLAEFKIIPYWEYDKVRICTLPNTYSGYPVELSEFSTAVAYLYYADIEGDDNLTEANSIYTYKPSDLIDVAALQTSEKFLTNTQQTVYGMVDTSGVSTTAFLTDEFIETIAPDIIAEFCAADDDSGDEMKAENYHLIVYTIKYEAIGDNVGWYICCKVVPNDTYLLQYDYNFPTGFDQFDIDADSPAKPNDQTVETDDDGNAKARTPNIQKITLTAILKNPNTNREQKVKAELKGWSKNPAAAEPEYAVGSAHDVPMKGNTKLYGVWEITEGGWEYTTFTWYIACSVVDGENKPITGEYYFTNTIYVDGASNFPKTYNVYDSAGNLVETKQFENGNTGYLTYTIPGQHYIVVEGVPTKSNSKYYTYKLEQTETASGFELQTAPIEIEMANSNTLNTGTLVTYITNVQTSYDITYNLDGGMLPEGVTNPDSYSKTETVTLKNPIKAGYAFTGWTGTGLDAATMTVTIPKGSTGDRVYTANWKVNTLTITQSGVQLGDTVFYQITGADFSMTLPISGTESGVSKQVTIEYIPEGAYTIQVVGNWTWTYSGAKSDTVNIVDGTGEVTFSFGFPFSRWLHDEAHN